VGPRPPPSNAPAADPGLSASYYYHWH
jgi:hypothetical protein